MRWLPALCLWASLLWPQTVNARDYVRIVGSTTVFPFSASVAEAFSLKTTYPTPIIEQLGTGGGLKLFCAGLGISRGFDTPDIANASRRMKPAERRRCDANGVGAVLEIKIGSDGIVLANAAGGPDFALTIRTLQRALAARVPDPRSRALLMIENPYGQWRDLDPSLPDVPITVFGPPASSGTRDAFIALVMEAGCRLDPRLAQLEARDPSAFTSACRRIRTDQRFIEAGENDNVIAQKLQQNPAALGILPFAMTNRNPNLLQAAEIDGVAPTPRSIATGSYSIARTMYIYVKTAHARAVPGLTAYLDELLSENAMGQYGYLVAEGLVPLSSQERIESRRRARALTAQPGPAKP